MSEPRKIKANIADMVSDGALIIHGENGEHLIVDMGPYQVLNLKRSVDKYVDYYKVSEKPVS